MGNVERCQFLPNHSFTGQAQYSKWLTSIVHMHSPETDSLNLLESVKGKECP